MNEVQVLEDGRVYIEYGPVSMVIKASKSSQMLTSLCSESILIIKKTLTDLGQDLEKLSKYPAQISSNMLRDPSLRMLEAVNRIGEKTLTPMATVAGMVADIVADWLYSQGADKVIVNNGGDIALRLGNRQSVSMKILSNIHANENEKEVIVRISEDNHIGGVCTSGLGGRSFTRGIANSVTVFSENCRIADACATHIANASYISSKRVHTTRAGKIQPSSDIADLSIVTKVDCLTKEEISKGIENIKKEAIRQIKRNNAMYVVADVQGTKFIWPPNCPLLH